MKHRQKKQEGTPIRSRHKAVGKKALMAASVASMIDQFNLPNIRLMQELGYEVHVACNFKYGNTCGSRQIQKLKQKLNQMEVVWHQWDCPRNIDSAAECCRAYLQLRSLTKAYEFAWIHCHSPVGGAIARLVAHRQGIQVIYTAHGFHFYKGAPLKNWLLYYPAEKLLAHWTDVLIVINKEDYEAAKRRLHAGNICYIPGIGVDIAQFRTPQAAKKQDAEKERAKTRGKYRIPRQAILILSVGELSSRKNHKVVLAALAKLSRQDVYYLICGQGTQRDALIHDANMAGIADRVRMPGFQEDMARLYQAADIFVFPSLQEGMPVALMEAMAAGLPCVVSDIRGNRELMDETGVCKGLMPRSSMVRFQPQDSDQLKEMLELMISSKRLRDRYGTYNSQKILSYDLSVVQKKMKEIYQVMR